MRNQKPWANSSWGKFAKFIQVALSVAAILFATGLTCRAQSTAALYSFTGNIHGGGANPNATLIRDAAGNLYGTTYAGGTSTACTNGCGTVFELVNSSGSYAQKVLHAFTGQSGDGSQPIGGLVMDSSGDLFGTTSGGGIGDGTVFELVPSASGYTESIIYTFAGFPSDGTGPWSDLILDSSGDIFGTTAFGGAHRVGTAFELVKSSGGYTEKILYSFGSVQGDGLNPDGTLVMDKSGNIFGIATAGGPNNSGTIFELVNSSGSYTEQAAYTFPFGSSYVSGLLADSQGNLYGSSMTGGNSGAGYVFELVNSSGTFTETTLASFAFGSPEGVWPNGGIAMDSAGDIFGTTSNGGPDNLGALYELVNSSGSYSTTVLDSSTLAYYDVGNINSFPYPPQAGAWATDVNGNLYGTLPRSGLYQAGAVFEYSTTQTTAQVLDAASLSAQINTSATGTAFAINVGNASLTFPANAVTLAGGNASEFAVTSDSCSGTTVVAGAYCSVGVSFTPTVPGGVNATLTFTDNAVNASQPRILYGQAFSAGSASLSPSSLTFPSQTVGTTSNSQPVTLSNSGLGPLGITSISITTNGSLFSESNNCPASLVPGGSCIINVTFTPTYVGTASGQLAVVSDGPTTTIPLSLSGTGSGVSSTGATLNILHSFSVFDGEAPAGGVLIDSSGNLFGATQQGGTKGSGVVYQLVKSSSGHTENILYSFPGVANDGADPAGPVIMDSAGDLFGVTGTGGSLGYGVVYEMVNSGTGYTEKPIYFFNSSPNDGRAPTGALVMDSAGDLFGVTIFGGTYSAGTVYELVNSSGTYTEQVLYNFKGLPADGASPSSGLAIDNSGDLFGTTSNGGMFSGGTVFELVKSSGGYSESILDNFGATTSDGRVPRSARLLMDSSGDLFGTTSVGGANDHGTVFELAKSAAGYTESVLYRFGSSASDGTGPLSGLTMDPSGNLYGETNSGGTGTSCSSGSGCGTIYELVNTASGYQEKLLYSFTDGPDGSFPQSDLILDNSGNLYGTAGGYPSASSGVVFELSPLPAPGVTLSAAGLGFGSIGIGAASSPLSMTVTNVGTGGLTFAAGAVTVTGPNSADFTISSDNCSGQTVAPNGNCTVGVTFSPTTATAEMAALDFADNAATSPQTAALSGTGLGPLVTLSSPSLTFAALDMGTTSAAQTVTVTNSGSGNLTFATAAATLSGTNAADFAIASDTCSGQTIAPAGTCAVGLTVTPSHGGSEAATLNLADNATGSPQTVALTGTGLASTVTLSTSTLSFAPLDKGATSPAQSVTVTNTGSAALIFAASAVTVAGPNGGDFAIASDTCSGQSIAPKGTCAVGVTFDPSRGGSESATLTLADNAAGSPQTVSLSGTGQDFKLGGFTTSETVTAGTTAPFEFQLSPQGGFTGTVSFTCTGSPSNSTCTVTPSSVTVSGSGPQDIELDVATTAPSSLIPVAPAPPAIPPAALWLVLAGLMGLLAIGIRLWPARAIHESPLPRARVTKLVPLAALLLFAALWASCGGGGASPVAPAPTGGTSAGTYTLTVTATSGSISQSANVTLIVK